jgi:tetratricopeptide (TPR) repeat protein
MTVEQTREKIEQLFMDGKNNDILDILTDDYLSEVKDATLYSWRARANYFDHPKKSRKDLESALELDEKQWMAFFVKGLLSFDSNKSEQASTEFSKVLELKSNYSPAYNNRALIHHNKGEYPQAIADFEMALQNRPNDPQVIFNEAITYEVWGKLDKAIEFYKKSIDLGHQIGNAENKINQLRERLAVELEENIGNGLEKIKSIVSVIRHFTVARSVAQVVHYSKLYVADLIAEDRDSHLHYSNVIYMNDPQEGKTFIDYLSDNSLKKWFEKASYKNESTIFLGSFLPVNNNDQNGSAEDQLLMWRTYGKDEKGIDAAGCNFVINTSFFEQNTIEKVTKKIPKTFKVIKDQIDKGIKYPDDNRNSLLRVQYIRDNKIIDDKNDLLTNLIQYLVVEVKELIKKNESETSDINAKNYTNTRIFDALQEMCHLFKSADYAFEHEVRVIKAESRNSRNIEYYKGADGQEPTPPKHFYIKSDKKILPHLSKIYLGPKVQNPLHWALHFDYSLRKEERELTELEALLERVSTNIPLNINESVRLKILQDIFPGGRDEVINLINPEQIEIIPSKCKFI